MAQRRAASQAQANKSDHTLHLIDCRMLASSSCLALMSRNGPKRGDADVALADIENKLRRR
jgi:hypothetical protein